MNTTISKAKYNDEVLNIVSLLDLNQGVLAARAFDRLCGMGLSPVPLEAVVRSKVYGIFGLKTDKVMARLYVGRAILHGGKARRAF